MQTYILRRLFLMLPSLIGVSIIVFLLIRLISADVVDLMLGQQGEVGLERADEMRRLFGLDRPLYVP